MFLVAGSVVIKLNGDDEVKNSFWPNSIQQAFPGGPSYVDAAFFFDNKIYLISVRIFFFSSKIKI